MTLVKIVKLLPKLIFLEKGLGMMFDDVPYKKKVFLDNVGNESHDVPKVNKGFLKTSELGQTVS